MGAHKFRKLMTVDELCEILNCPRSYIYQRTGPQARGKPRIPTVAGMKPLRFDPLEIERVFFSNQNARSLKIEQIGNSAVKTERKLERLW